MIIKTTIVVNFQFTKFSFIDFVLTDRKSLSGRRPKSAGGKSSSSRFSFSAERNANTKATEYVTFGFFSRVLLPGFSQGQKSLYNTAVYVIKRGTTS